MKRILCSLFLMITMTVAFSQQVTAVKMTALEKIISETPHPLLVNFWATWCLPCIEELPYFLAQADAHKKDSLRLLLVSLDMKGDFPSGIDSFLRKRKIVTRVVWLDEHDADYFCPRIDSSWSGAIPASLFINPARNYRKFYGRQLKEAELETAIREML